MVPLTNVQELMVTSKEFVGSRGAAKMTQSTCGEEINEVSNVMKKNVPVNGDNIVSAQVMVQNNVTLVPHAFNALNAHDDNNMDIEGSVKKGFDQINNSLASSSGGGPRVKRQIVSIDVVVLKVGRCC